MVYLGIDIGGTAIKCGCVDEGGVVLCTRTAPTPHEGGQIVARAAALCRETLDGCSLDLHSIGGVGAGCPGIVDARTGTARKSGNIPAFSDFPLAALLSQELGTPVSLQNDMVCALLAEAEFGAAKGLPRAALLTIGTGIGGGWYASRRDLWAGNVVGELGHHVIAFGGRPCACGNRGCLEAYCSCSALLEQMRTVLRKSEHNPTDLESRSTPEAIFEARKNGDPIARAVLTDYIAHLTAGIQNIERLAQPDAVLLGGGLSNQGAFLLDLIRSHMAAQRHLLANPNLDLRIARFRNDAGIVGASLLGRASDSEH